MVFLLRVAGALLLAPLPLLLVSVPIRVTGGESEIEYYSRHYNIDRLHQTLVDPFLRSERNPNPDAIETKLDADDNNRGAGSKVTTEHKLKVDLEQARYLSRSLENGAAAKFFGEVVAPIYEGVLERVPPAHELARTEGEFMFDEAHERLGISDVYNKAWHVTDMREPRDEYGDPIPLLSESFYEDAERIERAYFGEEEGEGGDDKPRSSVVVIDDLLTESALEKIRKVLLESTVWYETKTPDDVGKYVGAYINDGLHDRILLALAFELHSALPRIMKDSPLNFMWAYKYDSTDNCAGIKTHADRADVNVNIWITPDSANLDPGSGGLVVFTTREGLDGMTFDDLNGVGTPELVDRFLEASGYANVTVPYKQNRAVIFDSKLYHRTDDFKFKTGYENRRINLTILYGSQQWADD